MGKNIFKEIFDQADIGYACHEPRGNENAQPEDFIITEINPLAERITGLRRADLIGKRAANVKNVIPSQDSDLFTLYKKAAITGAKQEMVLYSYSLEQWYKITAYCPDKRQVAALFQDITSEMGQIQALEKYKIELYNEKELLRTTLDSIGDGVVTTDKEGIITSMNNAAEKITCWKTEEAKDRPFGEVFKLLGEGTGHAIEDPVAKVLNTGMVVGLANHTVLMKKDGILVPIADSAAPIKDETGNTFGVVMVFRDVSTEKEQREKILYLSQHDYLTGLLNRRSLENELGRLDNSGQLPLTVIMGDVNGLKLTNDVFGHEAGDLILQRIARTIRDNCRKGDIVSRWGGDEFLILLPKTTAEKAEKVIQRIKKSSALKSEGTLQLSISLGFAVKSHEDEDINAVIRSAEEMMYRKKLTEGRLHRTVIIRTLLNTIYEKGLSTEEHAQRMKTLCLAIGRKLKCSAKDLKDLKRLASLYDIGKTGVPESILKKPESLTPEEWEEVEKHPEIGFRIAQSAHEISNLAEYILFHHERRDGTGYPQGLAGEKIPLLSRILAAADAYNALIEGRPYKKALSKEEALEEMQRNAGTQFDREVVNAIIKVLA